MLHTVNPWRLNSFTILWKRLIICVFAFKLTPSRLQSECKQVRCGYATIGVKGLQSNIGIIQPRMFERVKHSQAEGENLHAQSSLQVDASEQ